MSPPLSLCEFSALGLKCTQVAGVNTTPPRCGTHAVAITDMVNHPPHYKQGTIEVIDVIEQCELPYHLGCVTKYVLRAGKKNKDKTLEDLKKAQWYLNRYIANMESGK
jgi:hypothetical protein